MSSPSPCTGPPQNEKETPDHFEVTPAGKTAVMVMWHRLQMIDLSRVAKLAHATPAGIEDYKKFFAIRSRFSTMKSGNTGLLLSPSDSMDAMWHAHILDTQSYMQCCHLLLGPGGYVHHDPYAGEDKKVQRARREFTKYAFKKVFGTDPVEGWGADPSEDDGVERVSKRKRQNLSVDNFEIFVKTLLGKTVTLKVDKHTDAEDLKKMIYEKEGIPPDQQRIIFAGHQFKDEEKLVDWRVAKQCTLHLLLKLGGC